MEWLQVPGIIVRGHRVASGKAENNPYPAGTIALQKPIFRQLGLDLAEYHDATLNISIAPLGFAVQCPELTFRQVEWTPLHPPEHFSFSRCRLLFAGDVREAWVYYPHPETKRNHFQSVSMLEVLAPWIANIHYGDRVELWLNRAEIDVYSTVTDDPVGIESLD